MYCKKCGADISERANFCPKCGNTIIAKSPKKKKKHKIVALTTSLIIFIGACSGIFVFRDEIMSLILGQKKFDENNIGKIYYQEIDEKHIATDDNGIMYADNEILLVARDGISYKKVEKLAKKYNAEIVGWIEQTGDYQLKLSDIYTINELGKIATDMESDDIIDLAYINYISEVSDNSVNYGKEWSWETWNENDHAGINWGLEAIHVLSAWKILEENENILNPIKLGLIDSGFDTNHEDLCFAETFYNTTVDSHGTHVAGTMAARSDNNEGICGVYPYGKDNLYGVAYGVTDHSENGDFFSSTIIQKISYAELILRNVKVINQSEGFNWYKNKFGTYDNSGKLINIDYKGLASFLSTNSFNAEKEYARVLADFLNRLLNKGYDFVIVSSAGNDSDKSIGHLESKYTSWNNMIDRNEYPDVFDRIIVVGSIGEELYNGKNLADILYDGTLNIKKGDSGYHLSNFSNLGNRVDVLAPGENIFSTVPNNGYKKEKGTSMAAPHVAGVAAMVWTANNNLTGAQVKKIICDSSHELFSTGAIGCEYLRTGYKLVDAYSAVKKALNIEEENSTMQKAENGGILCWVVNKENENEKIENATVIAINNDTGKQEKTITDSGGHFELILPEGIYILTVTADGYKEYTSKEIEVKNEGVNYLNDWIKLEKNEIPEIINNVLQNESEWIETINTQNDMAVYYNTVAGGDDYIWFQDIDMDGEPEFVTMSKYMPDTNVGTFRSFNIYSNKDNKFSFIATENSAVPQSGMIYAEKGSFESDTFNYSLWYDKNGKYHYLSSGSNGNVILGQINELIIDFNKVSEKPIITVYDENLPNKGCDINYISEENGVGYSFDNVLYGDGVEFYDDYFSYLTPCDTTVKKIKLTDYKAMTKEEKSKVLLDSFNIWAYTKNGDLKKPLEDVIDSIRNQITVSSFSDEYKESYKSLITGLSYEDSITTIEYTLYDMNNDNIPELVLRTGTCEADYKISFYTYKNNIGLIPVGINFSGFHTAFYVDKSTNQLCTQWGQNGIGGIKWYEFDGETVKEVKSKDNIEYATENVKFDNYADAYAPYGDFESLNSSNCFLSWNEGWIYYIDETLFSGIDYSLIDNY